MINETIPITNEIIQAVKSHWRSHVKTLGEYPKNFSGKGIVFSAGGLKYFTCAYISISILRKNGCSLPIEVWYSGKELSREMIAELEELDVDVRDINEYDINFSTGFMMKPLCITYSKFEEVLFMDSDNICVTDPTYLFEDDSYKAYGTIFWPDYWKTSQNNPIWEIMDVHYTDDFEQEGGQILINKRVCWKELNLCVYINRSRAFYYRLIYGDKDTFRFAWLALRRAYNMIETPVASCGYVDKNDNLFYGTTMVQYDTSGEIIFLHRNLNKWNEVLNYEATWKVIKRFRALHYENKAMLKRKKDGSQAIDIFGDVETIDFRLAFPFLENECLDLLKKLRSSDFYNRTLKYFSL